MAYKKEKRKPLKRHADTLTYYLPKVLFINSVQSSCSPKPLFIQPDTIKLFAKLFSIDRQA